MVSTTLGHELKWTPGVGDGQGGLACCGSWGHKESDMTEWLNWAELKGLLSSLQRSEKLPTLQNRQKQLWLLCWDFLNSQVLNPIVISFHSGSSFPPWESSQSILKEMNPEYSLEGLMLKLHFQYFAIWCKESTIGKEPDVGKRRQKEIEGLKAKGEGSSRG